MTPVVLTQSERSTVSNGRYDNLQVVFHTHSLNEIQTKYVITKLDMHKQECHPLIPEETLQNLYMANNSVTATRHNNIILFLNKSVD